MLLEQTHFPQNGPNWGHIILGTLTAVAVGYVLYNITIKPKFTPVQSLAGQKVKDSISL